MSIEDSEKPLNSLGNKKLISSWPSAYLSKAYSSYKLWSLGALSFAIPIVYFLQAAELKRKDVEAKEISKIEQERINSVQHINDSLKLVLLFNSDPSILFQRLKAYENYQNIIDSIRINQALTNAQNITDSDLMRSLIGALEKISTSIEKMANKTSTSSGGGNGKSVTPDVPNGYLTQKEFKDSIAEIQKAIRSIVIDLPNKESDSNYFTLKGFVPQLQFAEKQLMTAMATIDDLDTLRIGSFLTPNKKIRRIQRDITTNKKTLELLQNQLFQLLQLINTYKR